MKNLVRKIATLAFVPLLLAGCSQKVDFETWKTKIDESVAGYTENEQTVTSTTVKGTYQEESYDFKFESLADCTLKEMGIATVVITARSIALVMIEENPEATYYAGGGFKIETEDGYMSYNTKGHLTRLVDEETDLKISYTYKA